VSSAGTLPFPESQGRATKVQTLNKIPKVLKITEIVTCEEFDTAEKQMAVQ